MITYGRPNSHFVNTYIILMLRGILQELRNLHGGCLTVKNQWGLVTGDDGVCIGESNIYHQLVDFSIMGDLNRKVVIK